MSTEYLLKSSDPEELKHLNQTFQDGCKYNHGQQHRHQNHHCQPHNHGPQQKKLPAPIAALPDQQIGSEHSCCIKNQSYSRSVESLYSLNVSPKSTSLSMYKRKSKRIVGGINNNQQRHQAGSEVRQRVVSARLHRVRSLQNQLSDAQNHITELNTEIRVLRTLHKRQDSALSKYESHKGDLPQLLHSHAEELRIWETKFCNLQQQKKDLERIIKQKDNYILILTDHNKHFQQLSTDKNLEDRETLADRVRYLERRILEKDDEMKVLLRRTQLESKNLKFQLAAEQHKYKTLLSKYESNIVTETSQMTTGKSSKRTSIISRSTATLTGNTNRLPHNKSNFQTVHRPLATDNCNQNTNNPSSKLSPRSAQSNYSLEETTAESNTIKKLTATIHKEKSPILNSMKNKPNLAELIRSGIAEVNGKQKQIDSTQSDDSYENLTNEDDDDEVNEQENEDEINNERQDVDESETSESFSPTKIDSAKPEKRNSNKTDDSADNSSINFDSDNPKLNDIRKELELFRVTKSSNSSQKNIATTLEFHQIDKIRSDVREDILKGESFLDSFCDNLTKNVDNKGDEFGKCLKDVGGGDSSINTFDDNHKRSTSLMKSRAHEHLTMNRRQFIDPKQKSKLLQSLKAIDSN